MSKEEKNPFGEGFSEVTAGEFVKWETVGQMVKGILVDVEEKENALSGGMQKIYTFEDEDGVEFRVGSRGKAFDSAMKKIVQGQWVALYYQEVIPSKVKGNNPFKLIKVAAGQMDDEWLKKNDHQLEEVSADDVPFE